jgi:rhodanese-related sulfurtransferase
MPVPRISPEEAFGLMEREGYVYVDVRTTQEFDRGHPKDARNVPLLELGPIGPVPNPNFLAVMEKAFTKDARIVLGCQSGGRSLQAAALLERAGFQNLREQRAGFQGSPGPQGRMEPGWGPAGLPTETEAPRDHTYDALKSLA